ncbi:MAG: DUF1232 domain-containing protein [Actinomycetales bacterium]
MSKRAGVVADAVRTSSGRHPLSQRLRAVPAMLWATWRGRWPGAPKGRIFGGLAGVVYVLIPIDFMPEVLLGPFGLGDDIAIAAVSVAALLSAAEAYLDMRDGLVIGHGDVIEGTILGNDSPQR